MYQSRKRKISYGEKKNENLNYERSWQMILSRTYWTHCVVTEGITAYPIASRISVKGAVNSCVYSCYFTVTTATIVNVT